MRKSQSDKHKNNQKNVKSTQAGFVEINSLFDNYSLEDKGGYITQEFQDFGYRLALQLDDLKHKSLYMRLAKNESRSLLERCLKFVIDSNAKSKAKLFMWKLKSLKQEVSPK